jgi:anaerobic selenocysteine-containing dehydrogenase
MVADYDRIRDKIEEVFPEFQEFNTRVRKPGGFRLDVAASFRRWNTPGRKANFLPSPDLSEDTLVDSEGVLMLTTIRSHDQYNTTIYGLDDRYRGVFGRRDVVFMNAEDLEGRGLRDGDRIEVQGLIGAVDDRHLVSGFTAVAYDIPKGSIAGYYPEMNVVMSIRHFDRQSGTPSYKGVPVRVKLAD